MADRERDQMPRDADEERIRGVVEGEDEFEDTEDVDEDTDDEDEEAAF